MNPARAVGAFPWSLVARLGLKGRGSRLSCDEEERRLGQSEAGGGGRWGSPFPQCFLHSFQESGDFPLEVVGSAWLAEGTDMARPVLPSMRFSSST